MGFALGDVFFGFWGLDSAVGLVMALFPSSEEYDNCADA